MTSDDLNRYKEARKLFQSQRNIPNSMYDTQLLPSHVREKLEKDRQQHLRRYMTADQADIYEKQIRDFTERERDKEEEIRKELLKYEDDVRYNPV